MAPASLPHYLLPLLAVFRMGAEMPLNLPMPALVRASRYNVFYPQHNESVFLEAREQRMPMSKLRKGTRV